jgi:C-terminal processing protease CtpA/Prc
MTARTLTVSNVIKGSTAEKSDIQVHDRIITIDGLPVEGSSIDKLFAALNKPVGDRLALVLKRLDGSKQKVTLEIEAINKKTPTLLTKVKHFTIGPLTI